MVDSKANSRNVTWVPLMALRSVDSDSRWFPLSPPIVRAISLSGEGPLPPLPHCPLRNDLFRPHSVDGLCVSSLPNSSKTFFLRSLLQ